MDMSELHRLATASWLPGWAELEDAGCELIGWNPVQLAAELERFCTLLSAPDTTRRSWQQIRGQLFQGIDRQWLGPRGERLEHQRYHVCALGKVLAQLEASGIPSRAAAVERFPALQATGLLGWAASLNDRQGLSFEAIACALRQRAERFLAGTDHPTSGRVNSLA